LVAPIKFASPRLNGKKVLIGQAMRLQLCHNPRLDAISNYLLEWIGYTDFNIFKIVYISGMNKGSPFLKDKL